MTTIVYISSIIANLAIVTGAIIAVFQLRKFIRYTKADHERTKKQSTIEFYNEISKETVLLLDEMKTHSITGHVPIDKIEEHPGLKSAVQRYLSLMERFSVGVNTGVYDLYIFDRMAGIHTIHKFNELRAFIEFTREKRNINVFYVDFEQMVTSLSEIRKKRFPQKGEDSANLQYDVLKK